MGAVVRSTLYYEGSRTSTARVRLEYEAETPLSPSKGIEIVSDFPHFPRVSWKVDLDTLPVAMRKWVNDANEKHPDKVPGEAWVTSRIATGELICISVHTSHGNSRGQLILSPIKSIVVIEP